MLNIQHHGDFSIFVSSLWGYHSATLGESTTVGGGGGGQNSKLAKLSSITTQRSCFCPTAVHGLPTPFPICREGQWESRQNRRYICGMCISYPYKIWSMPMCISTGLNLQSPSPPCLPKLCCSSQVNSFCGVPCSLPTPSVHCTMMLKHPPPSPKEHLKNQAEVP